MSAASIPDDSPYLAPTPILDSDHPALISRAAAVTRKAGDDPVARAVALYYAVRDDIWYDPYLPFYRPEHYRASHVLESRRGFCIGKAGLLCALGRTCGIPSRLGFSTVRNHLATRQLIDYLGTDRFVYHGCTEFYLNGRWVKATPAFNIELCRRHGVPPLDFNGLDDAVFHAYNEERRKFMEYVAHHGEYTDVPVDDILRAWRRAYGEDRVQGWIDRLEEADGDAGLDFDRETVLTE